MNEITTVNDVETSDHEPVFSVEACLTFDSGLCKGRIGNRGYRRVSYPEGPDCCTMEHGSAAPGIRI